VILGINGWANLSGVIAGQLFRHEYEPSCEWSYIESTLLKQPDNYPLKVTLILIAATIVVLFGTRLAYVMENRRRLKLTENWTEQEFLNENLSDERRGDHKYTYIYGY
jgi:hypothetical protein